jgi:hypothetical protein
MIEVYMETIKQAEPEAFRETQHALLFAWIARAVILTFGEAAGGPVLRKAVAQYGQQRGRRMALRAGAAGDELTMLNFMAYGEWKGTPGTMEQTLQDQNPHLLEQIPKCPWYTAWDEDGLMAYGRFYCLDIDQALVSGFNPQLQVDVLGTRSNGAAACAFIFHDVNLTAESKRQLEYQKAVKPGPRAQMPWEYHTGHLFKTLEAVIGSELGPAGQQAVAQGLAEFSAHFGSAAAEKVLAFRSTDFDRLPER